MVAEGEVTLDVKDLRTHFFTRRGVAKAVDGVSFRLRRGETLGLVGESGSGKTMTGLSLLRLVPQPAGRIVGGEVRLLGENLLTKSQAEMRHIRGRLISMILQDPMTSLNPVFNIGFQVAEGIHAHQGLRGKSLWDKAEEALRLVRISSPKDRLKNYPHEMSGGMRQRAVGAIVLSCQPAVVIADESTTSLDVTIQAQYLQLLRDIQRESSLSIIFITHDFGIVAQMCDRVAVMYAGRIVESGSVLDLFDHPAHPYTRALLASVPNMESRLERLPSIEGQPPALGSLPEGCRFRPRCREVDEKCQEGYPPEVEVAPEHFVSCWGVM
ncbi:MAG: ABC transporter ATP-binding protein [Chloroflexota bacterium]|nr:MAG: ABC transporter ATP-binding protein [Chloroflexota bacterium]